MKIKWLAMILFCSLCLSLAACAGGRSLDLMDGVTPADPIRAEPSAPDTFSGRQMNFSVELLKKPWPAQKGKTF